MPEHDSAGLLALETAINSLAGERLSGREILARAVALLVLIGNRNVRAMPVAQVARRVGISTSALHRCIDKLPAEMAARIAKVREMIAASENQTGKVHQRRRRHRGKTGIGL